MDRAGGEQTVDDAIAIRLQAWRPQQEIFPARQVFNGLGQPGWG